MGEILGVGVTHHPGLMSDDTNFAKGLYKTINAPLLVDRRYRDRKNWPQAMLEEMGDDEGMTSARRYRARMWDNFSKLRREIDEFAPDFIVIFADDQYENFKEDIIPPFCIFGMDPVFQMEPHYHWPGPNWWNEPADLTFTIHGHRDGARYLASGLIRRDFPMPYAYKLHAPQLAHGFRNTISFLDWERKGFPHPIVPLHVNCYGSKVISAGGAYGHLYNENRQEGLPDPPGPSPACCMELGAKLAQSARESPYRIVLMASSSWSHCFLSPTNGYVIPDHKADRLLLAALREGDYEVWRRRTIEETEQAGHHEMLNWMVLAGAMAELKRKPVIHDYVETYIFQSDKCFASFPAA
jgi:hypothetical protein